MVDIPALLHITYPRQQLQPGEYKSLPLHVNCVVGVLHNKDHYVVMEIIISDKRVISYNGLLRPLLRWKEQIVNGMKRCMLVDLNVICTATPDTTTEAILGRSRVCTVGGVG